MLTPIASGVTVYKNDKATLDASNTASGYIMVKYTGSVGKIRYKYQKWFRDLHLRFKQAVAPMRYFLYLKEMAPIR